ncbi:aromatic ring-hydroxylating dioxygenase subunit alpha [Pseudomonas sp. LB3P14]
MLIPTRRVLTDGTPIDTLVDLQRREVSMRTLHDREIYELELQNIFAKTWLLLGHDTEIVNPGDYVVRHMGEDGVIVARDRNGEIHVSLNVCPHRGMRVALGECGNAMAHRCIYHGWAFRPNGDFIGSPVEREQMHGEICAKAELGLRQARVAVYGGLIFATWNIEGPSFDEFLGDMKWYLDTLFCRTDKGLEVLGPPQRYVIPANWKTASEQAAADGFHTLTAHRSLLEMGVLGGDGDSIYDKAPAMYGFDIGSPHGHALRCLSAEQTFSLAMGMDITGIPIEERLDILPPPGIDATLLPQVKRNMSPEQLNLMAESPAQVGGLFPNILIGFIYAPQPDGTMSSALSLHAYVPRGPDHFEFINWMFAEKDTPEEQKQLMLANAVFLLGTSGTIEQDDAEMWPLQTKSARGAIARQGTLKYQAICHQEKPADWPGGAYVYPGFTKDDTQWNWWKYWHQLMTKQD